MRPIDADLLVKELTRLKHDEEYGGMGEWYDYCIDNCIDKIRNTPTIDVAPTTHAYWKKSDKPHEECEYYPLDFFDCSACGWENPYADTSWFKFCPNCGAKMRRNQKS